MVNKKTDWIGNVEFNAFKVAGDEPIGLINPNNEYFQDGDYIKVGRLDEPENTENTVVLKVVYNETVPDNLIGIPEEQYKKVGSVSIYAHTYVKKHMINE